MHGTLFFDATQTFLLSFGTTVGFEVERFIQRVFLVSGGLVEGGKVDAGGIIEIRKSCFGELDSVG